MSIPAGWYPDPAGSSSQRWWDGTQWTGHLSAPAAPAPAAYAYAIPRQEPRAPEGTSPQTPWIWLVALLPLLTIGGLFLVDLRGTIERAMSAAMRGDTGASLGAQLAVYTAPGYLALTLGGLVIEVLVIVFALLDHRALVRRGVPQPFHWAYIFFVFLVGNLVYVIGRDVVVRRRTGRMSGAMWAAIAVAVVSIVVTIVYFVWQFGGIVAELSAYSSQI